MPSHILTQYHEFASRIENGSRMQAAGLRKGRLGRAHDLRQTCQNPAVHHHFRFHRWKALVDGVNGRLSAKPATRTGKNVACQLLEIYLERRWQEHIDDILRG